MRLSSVILSALPRLLLRRVQPPRAVLAFVVLGLCAAGCNSDRATTQPAQQASALEQLPDCEGIDVLATYEARPASIEGYYIVTDGARAVCQTDFDGLQALANRFESGSTPRIGRMSSDPMPGRGTGTDPDPSEPLESDPMPGHGTNPSSVKIRLLTTTGTTR